MSIFEAQFRTVAGVQPMRLTGRVHALRGMSVLVRDLPLPVGSLVQVGSAKCEVGSGMAGLTMGARLGEIVGFDGEHAIVMMLSGTSGVRSGDEVVGLQAMRTVAVGERMLGRVINGLGRPIDGGPALHGLTPRELDPEPVPSLRRTRIAKALYTGVRAIDLMTTLGRGQRMGVFAGPGVGKSTLLGAAARGTSADVSVIALIGERGREVRDFIEENLGAEGLARSVVVVATGDESPLLRARAAMVACAVAEHFRDAGKSVLLIMDSITRFAHAHRQIGLTVGEPPATRGYTPGVFAAMARLLERAGETERGSITGLYSILVEGDDMTEPVSDAARGILDGHIILSRALAQRAHFPAIDVLDSVSRVAEDVTDATHIAARRQMIRMLSAYRQVEDLVQIGAYAKGSNSTADTAIKYHEAINALLQQDFREPEPFDAGRSRMVKLALEIGQGGKGIGSRH